jgi:hypothetical protein
MNRPILWLATLAIALASPSAAEAQFCFRGRALPACRAYPILEFAPGYRLVDKAVPSDGAPVVGDWQAGYMQNVRSQAGVGGAVKITADSDGHRYGPVVGLRYWLGSGRVSLDMTAGMFLAGEDNHVLLNWPAPTAARGWHRLRPSP